MVIKVHTNDVVLSMLDYAFIWSLKLCVITLAGSVNCLEQVVSADTWGVCNPVPFKLEPGILNRSTYEDHKT